MDLRQPKRENKDEAMRLAVLARLFDEKEETFSFPEGMEAKRVLDAFKNDERDEDEYHFRGQHLNFNGTHWTVQDIETLSSLKLPIHEFGCAIYLCGCRFDDGCAEKLLENMEKIHCAFCIKDARGMYPKKVEEIKKKSREYYPCCN